MLPQSSQSLALVSSLSMRSMTFVSGTPAASSSSAGSGSAADAERVSAGRNAGVALDARRAGWRYLFFRTLRLDARAVGGP